MPRGVYPRKNKKARTKRKIKRRAQTGTQSVRGHRSHAVSALHRALGFYERARDAYNAQEWNRNILSAEAQVAVAHSHSQKAAHTPVSWSRDRYMRGNGNGEPRS